jgi:hypothetical protein
MHPRRPSHTGYLWRLILLGSLLLASGCQSLVALRGHAAGLRDGWFHRSELACRESGWDRWAGQHLQSGDIVFVRGESRILLGLVDFSKLSTDIADSHFSHVGLVSCEGDEVLVYDIVAEGARRMTFGQFMHDGRVWSVAVKRLRPEYQPYIPSAIAYCQQVHARQPKFDTDFRLDNERLYCSEMLELAFQSAGLSLAEPVPMCQLPHFDRLRGPTKRLIQTATKIDFSQPIYLPGNEQIGIWSCPYLDLVLAPTDPASPPQADETLTASTSGGSSESAAPAHTASVAPIRSAPPRMQ